MKKFKALLGMTAIAVTLSVIPFFSSCEKDYENDLSKNNYSKYLDIDVTSHIQFTSIEYEIMSEAFKRITNNVSYNGEQITPILSAQDMNMSERLFKYLYDGIRVNDDIVQNTIPLIKTKSESSTTVGVGYSMTTTKLTREETLKLMDIIQKCQNIYEFELATIAGGVSAVAGVGVAGFQTLKNTFTSNEAAKFANSNASESTFTITNISVSGTPYYSTTFQFGY